MMKKKRVFVGMSGGVDSSVAAALLKKQGYDVVGVFIKGYNIDGCSEGDIEDARRAAEVLKIPFYVFDMEKEYKDKVVEYMINGYRRGITPNPDVMCNKEIKFGLFLKKALAMGADYVATGHYVRLAKRLAPKLPLGRPASDLAVFRRSLFSPSAKNRARSLLGTRYGANRFAYQLFQAKDTNKDQSYFLWTLTQKQLKHCLFPISDYLKSEVRKIARKYKLPNADKKDSQGVCFLGKIGMKGFLKKYIPPKKGIVVNTKVEIVGEHDGAQFYTIGQRHIGVKCQASGVKNTNQKPSYVAEKDVKANVILVAEGENNPALYKKEIGVADINWISGRPKNQKILMRVRYRQPLFSATLIFPRKSTSKSASVRVIFAKEQKFVAPGQSAVFYAKNGVMLGGGVII